MMLSFITVSSDPVKVEGLEQSIAATFGTANTLPWELLVADGNKLDIFQGYNETAQRAKGEILIFTHDDVRFWSNALPWVKPLALVGKPLTGVIGAAGATRMPSDGCWWQQGHEQLRGAVYHPNPDPFGAHLNGWPFMAARFGRVAVCDGVLLMMSRVTFEQLGGFAADRYTGFHFYDMDLTFRATLAGRYNYVAPLPLYHGSIGVPNENWHANKALFIRQFARHLPYDLPA